MASFAHYNDTKKMPNPGSVFAKRVLISVTLLVFSTVSRADSAINDPEATIHKASFTLASMSASSLDAATGGEDRHSSAPETNTATVIKNPANQSNSQSNNSGIGAPAFLEVDDAFQLTSNVEDGIATLIWVIAPEHYLYQHAFAIEVDTTNAQGETEKQTLTKQAEFSQGIRKTDDYFGPVEVYYYQAIATLPLKSIQSRPITVKYQGCADAGLCYPVQTKRIELTSLDTALDSPL